MNDYRYSLDKTSKKYHCPNCGKKRFVAYIDNETGHLLPDIYGRCDREVNCAYHLNPYKDGYAQKIRKQENGYYVNTNWQSKPAQPTKPKLINKQAFIPNNVLIQTLTGYDQNTFIQNLISSVPYPLPTSDIQSVIELYYLGTITNNYMSGAVTFPFIDQKDNAQAIQVKTFDSNNKTLKTSFIHSIIEQDCKRKKKPIPKWLQAYSNNDKKVTCLFGEHLLSRYPNKPVALVEAPKTAIYGSLYFGLPNDENNNMLWLATYNKSTFNWERCKVLKNRDVYLFPDLSKNGVTFKEWKQKAKDIERKLLDVKIVVSELLENNANDTQRNEGLDLADFLINLNWQEFRS